jgi:hypothetical protein
MGVWTEGNAGSSHERCSWTCDVCGHRIETASVGVFEITNGNPELGPLGGYPVTPSGHSDGRQRHNEVTVRHRDCRLYDGSGGHCIPLDELNSDNAVLERVYQLAKHRWIPKADLRSVIDNWRAAQLQWLAEQEAGLLDLLNAPEPCSRCGAR